MHVHFAYCFNALFKDKTLYQDKYQAYQKKRPSQQLFKAFTVFVLRQLHVLALTGHRQAGHNI
jgi:hypothetical protein